MANLHLVSHTHWDREWYLTFQQFRLKLVHLVDGLLDLLSQDPDFRYFMLDGQTIVLEDYLQMRPERFEDLRGLIQSGRILVGPWYVLPDEFLVSPEALIRNLLQGERTCRRFGSKMMVGYIPDPFGHIGQMPQILQGFGIDSACVARGLGDQPAEFWWQAPDGSRVLMIYLRDSYDNAAGLIPQEPDRFVSEVCRISDRLFAHSNLPRERGAALLMFGTDHMEPPLGTSAAVAYANQHLDGDGLLHSTLPAYLEEVRAILGNRIEGLPVVEGELRACSRRHLLPGVLSSRTWIKQRNQHCQTLLEKWAEPFSTWAEMVTDKDGSRVEDPSGLLVQAWRLLMENHPHDSICGCSIDQVHAEMRPRFDQVDQIGEEIVRQSLETISGEINTQSGSKAQDSASAIVIFNPVAGPRTDLVQVTLELPPGTRQFEIIDDRGQILPHQFTGSGSRELIHVALDRKGFREGLGMIHAGQVMGLSVVSMHWKQAGNQLLIDVILSEKSQPDLTAWEQALAQAENYLKDPTIDTYIVRARSAPSASLIFAASQVPGYGYRSFWVRPVAASQPGEPLRLNPLLRMAVPVASRLSRFPEHARSLLRLPQKPPSLPQKPSSKPPYRIENEFFTLTVSEKTGKAHLYDKRNGQIWLGLNRFVSGGDRGDEYNYCSPEADTLVDRLQVRRVQVERGPVQEWIEIEGVLPVPAELSADRKSRSPWKTNLTIDTRLALTQGIPRLDIRTEIENTARDHRLRVHFPAPFPVQKADYDGHFEIVRRKTGVPASDPSWVEQPRPEQPQRDFAIVSNRQLGLALANRGLPEVEVVSKTDGTSEIALTLLRCTGWLSRDDLATRGGHAGPALEAPGAQEQGKHIFEYAVIPFPIHPADEIGSAYWQACRQAWAFNAPLRGASTRIHAGKLPAAGSLVQVKPADFIISAIKTAEDGRGWIVRGYNPTSEPQSVLLKPWQPFAKAWQTRLDETLLEELTVESDGSVCFTAKPDQVITVRFLP